MERQRRSTALSGYGRCNPEGPGRPTPRCTRARGPSRSDARLRAGAVQHEKGAQGMEAPRSSLNVHLSWPQTLALLGLSLTDEALPARLDCPLCGLRRLHVYPDVLCGGAWFACSDCGRCGDLIELAAALWGMDLYATLQHLAHLGV